MMNNSNLEDFTQEIEDPNKILIIGNSGVGKTCIMVKQTKDQFNLKQISTIGHDYQKQEIVVDSTKLSLNIWDTAGQEKYRPIIKQYFKGAQGVFLVCAVDDEQSLKDLKYWNKEVDKGVENKDVPKIVLANKSDLLEGNNSSEILQQLTSFCEEKKLKCLYTSAKTGQNIKEAFIEMCRNIIEQNKDNIVQNQNSNAKSNKNKKEKYVKLNKNKTKNKKKGDGGCC